MEKRCDKHIHFLKHLAFTGDKRQKQILIHYATKEQIKCFLEILGNIIYGVIDITDKEKSFLKKSKESVLYLWDKQIDIEEKRTYMTSNILFVTKILDIGQNILKYL